MNTTAESNFVLFAWGVLLVLHTVVSIGAYRWLARPTVLRETERPFMDVTTPEQEARGEKAFEKTEIQVVSRVPIPVLCYVLAGYAGLGIAAILGVVTWIRHGHP